MINNEKYEMQLEQIHQWYIYCRRKKSLNVLIISGI